jgi:hypothetical protein
MNIERPLRARINKGVQPYSGKAFDVVSQGVRLNGSAYVDVSTGAANGGVLRYEAREVTLYEGNRKKEGGK